MKEETGSIKQKASVSEPCVVCGEDTGYTKDIPIAQRQCYIEGAGQLCRKCYAAIYLKET